MRLFEKAKRHGTWNPSDIDFRQDAADWQRLDAVEREVLLHLTSLFQAGEEAVTADILPLILTVAAEGRLEEEMYLTTFLFEEAKHVEVFRRFLDEVAPDHGNIRPIAVLGTSIAIDAGLKPASAASGMKMFASRAVAASPESTFVVKPTMAPLR